MNVVRLCLAVGFVVSLLVTAQDVRQLRKGRKGEGEGTNTPVPARRGVGTVVFDLGAVLVLGALTVFQEQALHQAGPYATLQTGLLLVLVGTALRLSSRRR
jgi:hypothetical protein